MYPDLDEWRALRERVDPDRRAPVRPRPPARARLTSTSDAGSMNDALGALAVGARARRRLRDRARHACAGSSATGARTVVLAGRDPDALDARPRRSSLRSAARPRSRSSRSTPTPPTPTSAFVDDVFDRTATSTSCSSRSACSATRTEAEPDAAAAAEIARSNFVGAVSVLVPLVGTPASAGPRHDRRAVVGRRRARPQVELRLRLDQGRARRVLPGPRRQPGRHRRARHGRAARLRAHEDDRGPRPGAAVDHARRGRRRDRRRPRRGRETVWVPAPLRS